MNNLPTIGGAKGIFEIFVPGIFMLANLGVFLYFSPFLDDEIKHLIFASASTNIFSLIIFVSFGYLTGIILRLLPLERPDIRSAKLLKSLYKQTCDLWATDDFPYISWIERTCELKVFPPSEDVQNFFNNVWKERKEQRYDKNFVNYLKTMISGHDEKAAAEIYAAEALTRYVSGMFYALLTSFVLDLFLLVYSFCSISVSRGIVIAMMVVYAIALFVVLLRFRFIRIKEMETIFAASYKNKSLFHVASE